MMEEDEETPSMEDISSKDSFSTFASDPVTDIQSNRTEVDEMPLQVLGGNVTVSGDPSLSAVNGTDWSKEFETDMEFESRAEVIQWCQEVGKKYNMVLIISSSRNKREGKGSSVDISCDRRGSYYRHTKKSERSQAYNPKRKRSLDRKQCGCPFKLRSTCRGVNKWTLSVKCGIHNHTLPETLAGHAYMARLKKEEEDLVEKLTYGGVQPLQILAALKEINKDNHSTLQTIYNCRARVRFCSMEGRTGMQQLITLLAKYDYLEYNRRDYETDEVIDVFWSHPEAIMLAQCFASVLIIDCTNKTNSFKMPLFHVVGMTSTSIFFTVAYAFLKMDDEEHYAWALTHLKNIYKPNNLPSVFVTNGESALINAIEIVFPRVSKIVCTSHIDMTIHENCRKSFDNEQIWEKFFSDWKHVCNADTDNEYSEALTNFVLRWVGSHGACVTYICETWFVQKEKFARAWINKIKHYGITTPKKAEAELAKAKVWLGNSHGTFLSCYERMHKMFEDEHIEINASFTKSLTSVRKTHYISPFKDLGNHVSQRAMDYIVDEMKKMGSIDVASCRCVLRATHGLPCAHELVQYTQESRPIPLSAIDPQWKQLCSIPTMEDRVGFDFLPELQLMRQRWIEGSEEERRSLVEEMKELGTPIC